MKRFGPSRMRPAPLTLEPVARTSTTDQGSRARPEAKPMRGAPPDPSPAVGPSTPDHVTFRGNLRSTRYGWLRLTPAYSVALVRALLQARRLPHLPVLDPFCGTGTTLLACTEAGVACTTVDINPFLVWLAQVKSRAYSRAELRRAEGLVNEMAEAASMEGERAWVPNLHQIEKWWPAPVLDALSRAFAVLSRSRGKARDLCALAFCRTLIDVGHVSFRHQSMSFRRREQSLPVARGLRDAFAELALAAGSPLGPGPGQALLADSRELSKVLAPRAFGAVITSPPYANRMSYIRELRPYMYWLGYLSEGRQAGELDWRAIGGTWGVATSKLTRWVPSESLALPRLPGMSRRIARQSPLLARYVERYFSDLDAHLSSLLPVLAPGADLHYVVGNSKFFDVVLPVEQLLASLLRARGFEQVRARVLRRRSSKRELYEYLVSARAP